jgi:hypothetical protein
MKKRDIAIPRDIRKGLEKRLPDFEKRHLEDLVYHIGDYLNLKFREEDFLEIPGFGKIFKDEVDWVFEPSKKMVRYVNVIRNLKFKRTKIYKKQLIS